MLRDYIRTYDRFTIHPTMISKPNVFTFPTTNPAVKRCHPSAANDKHTEAVQRRWNLEVGYMTEKVSHDNIVRGIRVEPASFLAELERQQPTAMPVLLMEYCEGGDLRRLLNTSEYATGFPEMEARAVLRSLGAAIAYLHQMKITHRDIKPENIVMKTDSGGRKVYKLTDLGYAKALDHQTLVASLVGTLEYIAPELCMTDRYTNTVDYWSMGVIAYEICTGARPFVPHLPLARWMVVVKNKKSAHIAITEGNDEDSVRYESELPAEHRLSGTLAALLAPWLRLALEWNPKQRGHVFKQPPQPVDAQQQNRANQLPPTLELRIFSQLTAVLDKRILQIFDLHTCRTHSIELTGGMTMATFLAWIASATQIPADKVRMVLPVAHPLEERFDMQTSPTVLWWPDHDGPQLFIYRVDDTMATAMTASTMALRAASNSPVTPPGEWPLPDVVRDFVARPPPQHKWRPHVVRRFATAAYHACRAEQQRYREALLGWHSLALRLDHAVQLLQPRVETMQRQVYQLDGAVRLMASDTMRLLAEAVAAEQLMGDEAVSTVRHVVVEDGGAHELYAQLMERTRKILEACEKIARRYKSVHRRSQEACHRRVLERRDGVDLFGVERMGKTLEILRIQLQQKASVEGQVRDMLQAVDGCRQRRLELLQEKDWFKLQE